MKINRRELETALKSVDWVLKTKNYIPILDNIVMTAETGTLFLGATGTTTSVGVDIPIAGRQSADFKCTVHGQTLARIVYALNDESVDIDVDGTDFIIEGEGKKFKLRTAPVDDFPNLVFADDGYSYRFNRIDLIDALKLSGFALSADSQLMGSEAFKGVSRIAIDTNMIESKFEIRSSNYHVISVVNGLCEKSVDTADGELLFPRTALMQLSAILALSDVENIDVSESDNHIFVDIGNVSYSFRKTTLQFPNMDGAIAREYPLSFMANSKTLCDSLRRMQIFSDNFSVSAKWSVDTEELVLTNADADRGDGEESIEISFEGEPFEAAFNLDYVLDIFARTDENVELRFMPDGTAYSLKACKSGNRVKATFFVQGLKLSALAAKAA